MCGAFVDTDMLPLRDDAWPFFVMRKAIISPLVPPTHISLREAC